MPNKYADYNKTWKENNKDRELDNCRRWAKENLEHRRQYKRLLHQKQMQDPNYRLKRILRNRFYKVISGRSKVQSVLCYIGCTVDELRVHLEKQFVDDMSWDNHGSYWHVDHVVPLTLFDHSNQDETAKAWHFSNLQPLKALDNLRKGSKVYLCGIK